MATALPSLHGIRVLLVEDHKDTRDMFAEILTSAGALVRSARSAQEAVGLFSAADVVVTDIGMPGADGIWLLQQVRARVPHVAVIAVSGQAKGQDRRLAGAVFDVVLLKPIDPWRLCEEIEMLLRKRSAA